MSQEVEYKFLFFATRTTTCRLPSFTICNRVNLQPLGCPTLCRPHPAAVSRLDKPSGRFCISLTSPTQEQHVKASCDIFISSYGLPLLSVYLLSQPSPQLLKRCRLNLWMFFFCSMFIKGDDDLTQYITCPRLPSLGLWLSANFTRLHHLSLCLPSSPPLIYNLTVNVWLLLLLLSSMGLILMSILRILMRYSRLYLCKIYAYMYYFNTR